MRYKFKCPKCNKEHEINMPISQYTSEGHFCEECQTELVRDVSDYAGDAVWKCDGACGVVGNN